MEKRVQWHPGKQSVGIRKHKTPQLQIGSLPPLKTNFGPCGACWLIPLSSLFTQNSGRSPLLPTLPHFTCVLQRTEEPLLPFSSTASHACSWPWVLDAMPSWKPLTFCGPACPCLSSLLSDLPPQSYSGSFCLCWSFKIFLFPLGSQYLSPSTCHPWVMPPIFNFQPSLMCGCTNPQPLLSQTFPRGFQSTRQ